MAGVLKERMKGKMDPICMILVQLFVMGMFLLSKAALNQGMFVFALLVYRNLVGAIFVLPFALYFERDFTNRLSWKAFLWIFTNALLAIPMALGLYFYGLKDTTATYSSNFLNLIPIITFLIALLFRLEKLEITTTKGFMKLTGTLLCVGGTMLFSLYKGKAFYIWSFHKHHKMISEQESKHNWARGTLFLIASVLGYAFWFLAQAKLAKVFRSKYLATMLVALVGCLQALILGISMNREKSTWRLGWNLQLLTIIYSGVLNTGATYCLISWVIASRGPTYPTMFNPLGIIFTMIIESLCMGQEITVGSLLGTFFIIGGLYAFLWGNGKEIVKEIEDQNGVKNIELPPSQQVTSIEAQVPSSSNIMLEIEHQSGVNGIKER